MFKIGYGSTVGRLLRLPFKLIPSNAVLRILRGRLRGKKWIKGSSVQRCWLGFFEPEKQRSLMQLVKEGDIFYDIGAQAGFYSLLGAELVGSYGKVIAFEPVPENIKYIKKHLSLNNISNTQIFEVAVSDHNGSIGFSRGTSSNTGFITQLSQEGDFVVRSVSIDSLVMEGEIPPPHIIKMDIEGAEYGALKGSKLLLEKYRPIILLATHSKDLHKECCDYLTSFGYSLKPLVGSNIELTDEIIAIFK